MCTARFINDSLDKFLWNCEFKVFEGEIWVFTTQDIEPYHELFIPYGWYYWWCRRLTLGKSTWGECARAYHEISEKLNDGHAKHSYKERQTNKAKNVASKVKTTITKEERAVEHVEMWKHFPLRGDQPTSIPYPRAHKSKKINKSFTNKWQRIHTTVKDTYIDMEDVVNING